MQQEILNQKILNQIYLLQQTAYEASRALIDINVRTYESLVKAQFAAVGSCVDRMNNNQLKVVHQPKELAEYLHAHGELVKDCAEKALALSKENMDILTEARSEYNDLFEKGLAKAAGTLKPDVEKEAA